MKVSIAQILKNTFSIFKNQLLTIFFLVLFVGLAFAALIYTADISSLFHKVAFFTLLIASILLTPAFIFITRDWHEGNPLSFTQSYIEAIYNAGRFLIIIIAWICITLAGAILSIPAVFILYEDTNKLLEGMPVGNPLLTYLSIFWIAAIIIGFFYLVLRIIPFMAIYFIEKGKLIKSFKKSFTLTKGHLFKISIIVLVASLIFMPLYLSTILATFYFKISPSTSNLISKLIEIPATCFGSILHTCLYYELKRVFTNKQSPS